MRPPKPKGKAQPPVPVSQGALASAEAILVSQLPAYARNSRTHSAEQVEEILASILEFGWTMPVLYDAQGMVAGHGRAEAAELGYSRGLTLHMAPGPKAGGSPIPAGCVPALDCSGWSEAQRRAYIIADNRLAEKAGWDAGLLRVELAFLETVPDFDVSLTGFESLAALDKIMPVLGQNPIGDVPEDNYQEQFGVIVICRDEAEQRALYERFRDEGLGREVKVVKT